MIRISKNRKIIVNLLVFVAIFLSAITIHVKEIHSTKTGGDWFEASTWLDGVVPSQTDNVYIDGNVKLTKEAQCDSIWISLDCNLEIGMEAYLKCIYLHMQKEDNREGTIMNYGKIEIGPSEILR